MNKSFTYLDYYYYYYCYYYYHYHYHYYYNYHYQYFYFILNEKRSFLNYIYKKRLLTSQLIQKLKPFPMHSFPTPWKHPKTAKLFDIFRGQRKGALGTKGLKTLNLQ